VSLELRRLEQDGKVGAEAFRDGDPAGFLLAELKEGELRGRHAWSGLDDHRLEQGESPELYRDLYAAAAPRWVETGHLDHYVVVAADDAVLDAWYRLSFAQQQVHAALDLGPVKMSEPRGFTVRLGGPDDLEAAMSLAFAIFDHQAEAPTWTGVPKPPEDEVRESYAEFLADPGVTYFLAERDGDPVGHLALERESESSVYHAIAATVPETRGLGVGKSLTETALHWAHEQGYATCVTDWRTANLLSSRFWPARGFRPTAYRLYRSISPTPTDPRPRSAQA
jgi:GNAT superfamily N-acetyltransferase